LRIIATITLLVITPAAPAQPPTAADHFAAGRALVQQGRDGRAAFRRAAESFETLRGTLGPSPELCLNLGKAAYLADDLPRAVWAFRQGLLLAPADASLREHLEYARAQVNRPDKDHGLPEPDPWPWWLPRWHMTAWFWALSAGSTIAWAALGVWWIRRRGAWLSAGFVAGLAAACAAYALCIVHFQERAERTAPGIVVNSERTGLHTGNGPSYPRHAELGTLYAGMEARRLAQRGGWLQIQFASGEIGWVRRADVLMAD
jgi:hypothetical protein